MALYHFYLGPSQKEIDKAFESISDEEYSLEGISITEAKEKLKKRIESIRNIIQNVFSKILIFIQKGSTYLVNYYNKDQKRIEAVKAVLDDKDKLELYKKALLSMYTRTPPIVNQDGSLIDLDQFEKDKDWYSTELENDKTNSIVKEKTFSQSCYHVHHQLFKSSGIVVSEIGQLDKLTVDSIEDIFNLKTMKKLQKDIGKYKLPDKIGKLSDELDKLRKNNAIIMTSTMNGMRTEHYIAKLVRELTMMKTTFSVYQCLLLYIKSLISETKKKDIFTVPFFKSSQRTSKLCHLSLEELTSDTLIPRYPGNKGELLTRSEYQREILPKRVSFSPTVKEAIYAIHQHFHPHYSEDKDKRNYIDCYYYEGIPDENTLVVKEKYAKKTIMDWKYTREIVVVKNPIQVKKMGKIRIYFKKKSKDFRTVMGTLTNDVVREYDHHVFLSE